MKKFSWELLYRLPVDIMVCCREESDWNVSTGITALRYGEQYLTWRNMVAVSLIKSPQEQAPGTRFRRKLADNIKVYSMFAAPRRAVLPVSFKEQADRVIELYIYIYK